MKRWLLTCIILLLPAIAAAKEQRLISLKPNITEIVFALGAGDELVGVTTFCDTPEAAKRLPKVADYTQPFAESIVAARPSLILTSKENASRRSIAQTGRIGYDFRP